MLDMITLVGFVAIFFMLFTRLINMQMNSLKMSVEKKIGRHLDDLEKYSEQVESLYETLRSFRHILMLWFRLMKHPDERHRQIKMIYDSVLKDSASDLKQQSLIWQN